MEIVHPSFHAPVAETKRARASEGSVWKGVKHPRGNQLEIRGRTDAAVAHLASGSDAASATVVSRPEAVLVTVGWRLQSLDSNQGPGG
jgi:hypothetical protein